jgi:hypothetical protein
MKDALKELRKIIQIPDQKHWNCMEMRERALEEWIDQWVVVLEHEQTVLNSKYLTVDFQDFLKEHVGKKLMEKAMEGIVDITMENTKIKGKLACIKRQV